MEWEIGNCHLISKYKICFQLADTKGYRFILRIVGSNSNNENIEQERHEECRFM